MISRTIILVSLSLLFPTASFANNPTDLNKVKNWCRLKAEQANGGLSLYRAEPAMHGPSDEAPCFWDGFHNNAELYTCTFLGGQPGMSPSIRTVCTADKFNEQWEVNLTYNGPMEELDQ